MLRLKMKQHNIVLKEKPQSCQLYPPEKLIDISITGEEMLPSNRSQIIGKLEQRKFKYSHLGKAQEKRTEMQFGDLNLLKFSNKTSEFKKTKSMFPQNQMNDL